MKILLTADIHGSELAVKMLKAIGKCFDFTIVCGDVSPKFIDEGKKRSEVQKEWFENVFLPLMEDINGYFILGNDDFIEYEGKRVLRGFQVINGLRIFAYDKVLHTPFNTNREVSDEDIWMDLRKVEKALNLDLFVTHAPPYGILDKVGSKHFGSQSIRGFAYWQKPKVHCFGHIHESFGVIEDENSGIVFINAAFEIKTRFVVAEFSSNKSEVDVYTI